MTFPPLSGGTTNEAEAEAPTVPKSAPPEPPDDQETTSTIIRLQKEMLADHTTSSTTEILDPPPQYPELPEIPIGESSTPTLNQSKPNPKARAPKPHPIQGGRNGPIGLANPPPSKPSPKPSLPNKALSEPRIRKEVKVREGGANDIGSLAARVKNLVIENQKAASPRDRKNQSGGGG